ncbi:HTH-type transcriptional regulator YodB [Periweissella fabaria]|uniref:HTH-type transcriptional regulator YodB n=2 Tax=Periweissella fabaria TaxID=546157 RepID=A0ABM8Z6C2_9LACO|nr:HTH-type transcriptional regulator YodB [Periweissella fabaria]
METKEDTKLCPKFMKTFEILGRKWNGLIIEVLLNNGPSRFKDLTGAVCTCSDRVLVERLKELEEGLVERRTYVDSALIEYALTERGEAMRPLMDEIHEWADETYGAKA